MSNECKYVESTEYGKYCSLINQGCNNPQPDNKCENIERYWNYLEEMGVEVASEEEIEESFNDPRTV